MKIFGIVLFFALITGQLQAKDLDEAIQSYEKGNYSQALLLLKQAGQSAPQDAEVRFWLAKSYMKTRDWGAAVRELEKAVALQPANPKYHLWLGRAYGERASRAFFTSAFSLARKVVKEFEIARNLAPKDTGIRFDLLEFYLQAPGIVGGGSDKAQSEAQLIAQIDPIKGFTARAAIYRKEKKWDKAKAELLRATEEYPQNANTFKDLADFLLEQKDYEGALHYGKKSLALNSQSKRVKFIVAVAEIQLKKNLDDAMASLQELAAGSLRDEEPTFEETHYWLGQYYLAKGDAARARNSFKTALVFNPDYARAKNALSKLP